jgi:hypothetical protein
MRRPAGGYGRRVIPVRATAALWCALLAVTGCAPSEPSPADWRSTARQALEDTVSEVESVALVLELERRGRLLGRAARVAAVESETALAMAEESVSTLQPPPGEEREDAEVSDLLGRAGDLVRDARVAITAQDEVAYDDLRARLLELSEDLDAERAALR